MLAALVDGVRRIELVRAAIIFLISVRLIGKRSSITILLILE